MAERNPQRGLGVAEILPGAEVPLERKGDERRVRVADLLTPAEFRQELRISPATYYRNLSAGRYRSVEVVGGSKARRFDAAKVRATLGRTLSR